MSEKIRTRHLEKKAILYVRQSSAYQVMHNLESQKLQYAMEKRLRQLGWREIEVVDEDLAARPPAPYREAAPGRTGPHQVLHLTTTWGGIQHCNALFDKLLSYFLPNSSKLHPDRII